MVRRFTTREYEQRETWFGSTGICRVCGGGVDEGNGNDKITWFCNNAFAGTVCQP